MTSQPFSYISSEGDRKEIEPFMHDAKQLNGFTLKFKEEKERQVSIDYFLIHPDARSGMGIYLVGFINFEDGSYLSFRLLPLDEFFNHSGILILKPDPILHLGRGHTMDVNLGVKYPTHCEYSTYDIDYDLKKACFTVFQDEELDPHEQILVVS